MPPEAENTKARPNTILRVSSYLFRYKGLFWLTIGLAAGMTLLEVAVPKMIQVILDSIQAHGQMGTLLWGVGIIGLLYVGSECLNSLRIRVNNRLEQQVLLNMRRDLHEKLLRLPASFYDQRKSGEISSRVIEDVAAVERALLDGTEQGTGALLRIVGITAILFTMEPALAWGVFLPVPILLILGVFYSKKSRTVWKGVRESAADLNSLLVEDIQGNRLIQSFGLQARESARFDTKAQDLRHKTLAAMYRWALYSPGTSLITKLGFLSIVGVGGYFVLQGAEGFTIGKLIAFFLYANMLYMPLSLLHGLNHLIAAGRASGERVFEILDTPLEVEESDNPYSLPKGPIEARFEKVNFAYPTRDTVLHDFNLTIAANQATALVGHTGAGKSTVANLAMRTCDANSGTIRLSGIDIRDLALNDLHDKVGHVAQDPFFLKAVCAITFF